MTLNTKKLLFRLSIIIFAIAVICSSVLLIKIKAHAAQQGDEDNVNIHLKVEASSDNGVTWHNFGGTEFAEAQSITITPGATILVRLKIWNSGIRGATNITGSGTVTNPGLIANADIVSDNGGVYDGDYFEGSGNATLTEIGSDQTEADAAIFIAQVTFINNFPSGETIFDISATIDDYEPDPLFVGFNSLNLLRFAKAQGVGEQSNARVLIVRNARSGSNNNNKLTPAPLTSSEPTRDNTQIPLLPQTGC